MPNGDDVAFCFQSVEDEEAVCQFVLKDKDGITKTHYVAKTITYKDIAVKFIKLQASNFK